MYFSKASDYEGGEGDSVPEAETALGERQVLLSSKIPLSVLR